MSSLGGASLAAAALEYMGPIEAQRIFTESDFRRIRELKYKRVQPS